MTAKYQQLHDGEWVRPIRRSFREQCCDCGLVHVVDFKMVNDHIMFRCRRDARSTAAARRNFKFTKDED